MIDTFKPLEFSESFFLRQHRGSLSLQLAAPLPFSEGKSVVVLVENSDGLGHRG